MQYVYIIYSKKTKKRYIGKTNDLKLRLSWHNRGLTKSTKPGIPWKLIYYQAFLNKKDASQEELFLKTGKGRERLKFLLKNTMENL